MGSRKIRVLVGETARQAAGDALPRELIDHALDPKERVRWERNGPCRLLVMRVPRREREGQPAFETIPVGIVVAPLEIVVVSSSESDMVQRLRAREGTTSSVADLLVAALHEVAQSFADTVELTQRAIDDIEAALARSLRNTEVLALLRHQKALMHHSTALRALVEILDHLPDALDVGARDPRFLAEVAVELRQTLEVADLERETLGATMDAFASIISNNLNDVMRVLAGAAVVLTPPVTIASFWGMNVALPLRDHPQAFFFLVALSLAVSGIVYGLLRLRRWL